MLEVKSQIPLVSVIVPAFNAERTICKCMDSILKQTLQEIEIIVVNDGSTDKTTEILQEYGKKYENSKIIHKANGGVSAARNDGLKIATGKYIAFVDSDDYITKIFCEEMLNAACIESSDKGRDSVDIVICDYTTRFLCFQKNNQMPVGHPVTGKQDVEKDLLLPLLGGDKAFVKMYKCTNKLYKRDFLCNNNISFPIDIQHGEDCIFVSRALSCANCVNFISNPLYIYRRFLFMRTLTTTETFDSYFTTLKWRRHLEDIASQYPTESDLYKCVQTSPLDKIQRLEQHIGPLLHTIKSVEVTKLLRQMFEDETYRSGIAVVDTTLLNPLQIQAKDAVEKDDYEVWLHVMRKIVSKQSVSKRSLTQKVRDFMHRCM